jgi:hypothetical protein
MANRARLTLTRIKYDGDTIGSQTDFLIEAAGSSTPIKTDIKHGKEKTYSKVVYEGESSETQLKIPMVIQAGEKDKKTSESKSRRRQTVLLSKGKPNNFSVVVDVTESGDLFKSGNTAHFIFDFVGEYAAAPVASKPKTTSKKR